MRVTTNQYSLLCLLFLILSSGCENSVHSPQEGWVVSGTTYLVGSPDPISDVVIRCGGVTAKSRLDGSYSLLGVPGGKQVLTAERQDCDKYVDTIEVKSDTRRYVYLSLRTTKVWGHITNAIDGPVQGATVKMRKYSVATDSSGRYEFPRFTGIYETVSVTHPLYVPYSGYVGLNFSEERFDVKLTRQRVYEVSVTEDSYVDESRPDATFGSSSILLLSTRVFGQFEYLRHVYLGFDLPEILKDERVTLLSANLQLTMSSPTPPITVEVYSVASSWSASGLTYNRQPARGPLLERRIVGTGIARQSWSVLTTAGMNQLLAGWRGGLAFYGVVLQGGPPGTTPCGFYSNEVTSSRPKFTLQVQY